MKYCLVFLLSFLLFACSYKPQAESQLGAEAGCSQISVSQQVDDCARLQFQASQSQLAAALSDFEARTQQQYAPVPALGEQLM